MPGITQHQIAARLGVSRSAVAAVLSNTPKGRISPALRESILATAREMGYVPNRHAQIMSKGKSGMIGIINFGLYEQLPQQKVQFAARALLKQRYEPVVSNVLWFADRGGAVCRRMVESRVEGVLLVHPTLQFTQKHLDILLDAGIPVVVLGGTNLKGVTKYMSDKEHGFYVLTSHLLDLGYRRLTVMLGRDSTEKKHIPSWHARNAIAGFERALKEKAGPGVTGSVHLIHRTIGANLSPYEPGRLAMHEILQKATLPEAVLCSNDNWAMGALAACAAADLKVPEEIAITGFENEPLSQYGLLPLTTMAHPAREIAEKGVKDLLSLVRRESALEDRLVVLPCELVVRRSCGAHLHQHRAADVPQPVES
ncbi:MAG TPA: LacI family DNA-binding transcriptional regulator [Chthoniobacteraceae bacterium]|nr:LacI family DNA-binding transcriptional regulator [Chthoniobacteraceae bacterium]